MDDFYIVPFDFRIPTEKTQLNTLVELLKRNNRPWDVDYYDNKDICVDPNTADHAVLYILYEKPF